METATHPVAASAAVRSRGGFVLVAALTVDSVGNGLFAPLSLVYFVRLTEVPLRAGRGAAHRRQPRRAPPAGLGGRAGRPLRSAAAGGGGRGRDGAGLPRVRGSDRARRDPGWRRRSSRSGVRVFWCTIFTLVADYADGRRRRRGRRHLVRDQQRGPHGGARARRPRHRHRRRRREHGGLPRGGLRRRGVPGAGRRAGRGRRAGPAPARHRRRPPTRATGYRDCCATGPTSGSSRSTPSTR